MVDLFEPGTTLFQILCHFEPIEFASSRFLDLNRSTKLGDLSQGFICSTKFINLVVQRKVFSLPEDIVYTSLRSLGLFSGRVYIRLLLVDGANTFTGTPCDYYKKLIKLSYCFSNCTDVKVSSKESQESFAQKSINSLTPLVDIKAKRTNDVEGGNSIAHAQSNYNGGAAECVSDPLMETRTPSQSKTEEPPQLHSELQRLVYFETSTASSASALNIPDSFFELTEDDLRLYQVLLSEKASNTNKKVEDSIGPSKTSLRIRFSESEVMQACFLSSELVQSLFDLVAQHVEPVEQIIPTTETDCGLLPAATLFFKSGDTYSLRLKESFKNEYLCTCTEANRLTLDVHEKAAPILPSSSTSPSSKLVARACNWFKFSKN
ncbi:uncharacterized protein LOC135121228 [Zophobas morio]|uniref:uncharacterized protein LOC135121228 n=1 Tax=Zophobas morio TaxID=2755281 RepID=UPI003083E14F